MLNQDAEKDHFQSQGVSGRVVMTFRIQNHNTKVFKPPLIILQPTVSTVYKNFLGLRAHK